MPHERRRILCAESNEDVADLIARVLEQKGYEVRTARTVTESVGIAVSESFDLYLLNDTYVDGDSFELMRMLKSHSPETPVLMFSLEGRGDYQERITESGIQYYRSKTSDFAALVQTVDRLLSSYGAGESH